jgi:hypothetical protein
MTRLERRYRFVLQAAVLVCGKRADEMAATFLADRDGDLEYSWLARLDRDVGRAGAGRADRLAGSAARAQVIAIGYALVRR